MSQIEIVDANRCVVGRRQPAVQGGDRRLRLAAARARVAAAEGELQVVCRGNYSSLLISNSTTSIESVQGPKKWFAAKEGPRQEQAIFSGSV